MVHHGIKLAPPPETISLIDGSRRRIHRVLKRYLNTFFLHATSLEPQQLCIQSKQIVNKLRSCQCHGLYRRELSASALVNLRQKRVTCGDRLCRMTYSSSMEGACWYAPLRNGRKKYLNLADAPMIIVRGLV